MDPALKKQYDTFKKRASNMPTVEAKQTKKNSRASQQAETSEKG